MRHGVTHEVRDWSNSSVVRLCSEAVERGMQLGSGERHAVRQWRGA